MNAMNGCKPPGDKLTLNAVTAADLMTPSLISVRARATIDETIALLTEKNIGAAPVIDLAGRPIGVISRSDIVAHTRQSIKHEPYVPDFYADNAEAEVSANDDPKHATCAAELMTPIVFAVAPDTPARQVIEELLKFRVHRLFVVDYSGVLVGVVSALDILRKVG